jgi:peptide/nickel transport system substrate-binding protein
MKSKKSLWKTALVATAAATLVLTGCAPGGDEPAAQGDDTLTINWGGFPLSWAPGSNAMQPGHWRLPYESLLNRTREGEIQPNLATEWEFGQGAMSITLTLRDDVVFHDGTPFNADAVAANIDYVANVVGGQYGGPFKAALAGTEVIDDTHITINFTRPYGTATTLLSGQTLPMGSPAAIADGSIETAPVGTGPWAYDAEQSVDGSTMFFAQFADYWGEVPPMTNIELVAIPDDTAAAAAVLSGEVDVTDLEPEGFTLVEGSDTVDSYEYAALRQSMMMFSRGPDDALADQRVRQALCYAIDQDAFTALEPTTHIATQHFIEGEQGFNPDIEGYAYDLDRATELLEEAGSPTIDLTVASTGFVKTQLEVYVDSMNRLPGVSITIQELAVPEYVSTWSSGAYAMGIGSQSQLNPADWYSTWFSPFTPNNPSKYTSPELNALASAAQQTPPGDAQDEAWAAVMAQISEEALACAHAVVDQIISYNTDAVADVQPTEIAGWEINLIDYRAVRPAGS